LEAGLCFGHNAIWRSVFVSTIHFHQPIHCIMVYLKRGEIILDKNRQLLEKVDLCVSFSYRSMDSK
jgi:hypothetical protein